MTEKKPKAKPVKVFRDGGVSVSIWKNTKEDDTYYNTSIQNRYLDGDTWTTTESYSRWDLPKLAMLLQLAYSYVQALEMEDKAKE